MEIETCMKNVRRNLISEYAKSSKNSLAGFACQCEINKSELDTLIYGRYRTGVRFQTLITICNALGKPLTWIISDNTKGGAA